MKIKFAASKGEKVRFVIVWDSHTTRKKAGAITDKLETELDLQIRDPKGKLIGVSGSYDSNWEMAEFTARVSGDFEAWIERRRFEGAFEYLGVAWHRR